MIDKEIRETLNYLDIPFKLFENPAFDNAIVGISNDDRLVYSYDLMVEDYMLENDCSMEEAIEFIDVNTLRSIPYAGEHAPIVYHSLPID